MRSDVMLRAALGYALRFKFAVFPVHSVSTGGLCTCGDPGCARRGKHPRTPRGVHDATTDPDRIRAWWTEHPESNIGIAMGSLSGVWALDVDGDEGQESLAEMAHVLGALPDGPHVLTGRGVHYYYRVPEGDPVGCPVGIMPGVDVRGEGSYVVAPPSVHVSGRVYAWEVGAHPKETPFPEAPAWLLNMARAPRTRATPAPPAPDAIPDGQRNATLASLAGSMRRRGMEADEIAAGLLAVNANRCTPPVDEDEVRAIAASVGRYPPSAVPGARPEFSSNLSMGIVGTELPEASGAEIAAEADGEELATLPVLGVSGLVVEGWSHLLAGFPRSGKTELLARCIAAWITGGATVLYVTEEGRPIWRKRLRDLPGPWEGLRLAFGLGCDPAALLDRVQRGVENIVIVDTLRNLLRLQDESDNSLVAREVGPWVAACRATGKTFIGAHHTRKGGGDHGEGIAGGHALLGLFDVGIELLRDKAAANRRILRAYARLIAPPDLLYERTGEGTFRALGDPGALAREELAERVLAVLGPEWRSAKEIHEELGEPAPSPESVRGALKELAARGAVERDPPWAEGLARGKRHLWRFGSNVPHVQVGTELRPRSGLSSNEPGLIGTELPKGGPAPPRTLFPAAEERP